MAALHRIEQLREIGLKHGNQPIYEVSTNSMIEPSSLANDQEEWIKKIEVKLKPLEEKVASRYTLMRTALLVGFAALIVSRSFDPVLSIVRPEPAKSNTAASADSLS
jgi:hypothetical protein